MQQRNNTAEQDTSKLLDLEKYRLKLKLKDAGVEWHEDRAGKFKIWVRLATRAAT
ncbi:MAG: hypothetical protein JNJ69_15270 [Leptospiraceae bacterium]|nr:hypothetical protein [Leptospiraceae bacterium]